jgi:hypothetical protein
MKYTRVSQKDAPLGNLEALEIIMPFSILSQNMFVFIEDWGFPLQDDVGTLQWDYHRSILHQPIVANFYFFVFWFI